MLASMVLHYGGIELPEPLSLTEVTEQMTPTGDLETGFITPHASVILPGLPRSVRASERAGIVGFRRVVQ
jgi:hypothetical protein